MPNIFSFEQGSERNQARINAEASPLLGRFRAVPRPQQSSGLSPRRSRSGSQAQLNLLTAGYRGSVHVGYGALLAAELEDEDDDEDADLLEAEYAAEEGRWARWVVWWRRLWRKTEDTWVTPKAGAVKRTVDLWWTRWAVLVVLPAALVSLCRNYMGKVLVADVVALLGRNLGCDTIPTISTTGRL
jgi:hypothetical protein